MVLTIQKDTNQLEKLKNELGEEPVNQIGFIIPNEKEEDDEEDDF